MSKPPVQQPRRSRDHPAFVPNTVTRARYIIRTRAQAQHLGSRPPLHDALTNSPTKMPRQAHGQTKGAGAAENSGLQSKKRALSPSPHDDPPEAPAKRLKPLVFSTPSTRPAVLPAPLAESRCSDELADATTPRLQQFPVIVGSPDRSHPTAGLSTPTASPMKVVAAVPSDDIFNPTIPQVQGGSSHNHQQQINIDHTIHDLNETPLPGPKLFDVSVRTDDEQTPHAGPSHRRTFSVASEDETMVLDSPSKKAKLSSGLPALPKSSMIPRRIPTQPITKQSLITSFLQAPNAQRSQPSTITKGPVVGTHIPLPRKASAPHSPTKRSVSSGEDKSQLSGAPSRPSTSLGFSDPSRRSSLQVSTQESLSNLEMALEKLKIPRMRASIGVASAPPANPAAKLNSTRPSGAPTARASVGSARPIARAPSFRTASLGSGAAGPSAGGRTGPPGPRVGLGRPTAGGPARRVLSSMGPPPARSAGMALNVQSSTAAADAPATSSPAPLPSTADPEATQTPPSAEAATREDKRNRRASIALRSLAGGSGSSPDAPGSLPATEPIDGGGSTEKKRAKKLTILKDCVIFVDVKTDDGSDAGELFINMLKGLGGRIISRLTPSITHIVYKSGSPTTLAKYQLYNDPKPHLVGIGWVVECVEKREKVDEARFLVDEVAPVVFEGKRRKSMVPAMSVPGPSNLFNPVPAPLSSMKEESEDLTTPPASPTAPTSVPGPSRPFVPAPHALAPLQRARQKSLAFAPKISSPLKATFRPADPDSDDDLPDMS